MKILRIKKREIYTREIYKFYQMKIRKINFKIKMSFKKKKNLKKINRKIIKMIKTMLINQFVNFKTKNNKAKFRHVEYFLKIKRMILIF